MSLAWPARVAFEAVTPMHMGLAQFNSIPTDEDHPFFDLPQEQEASPLELASQVGNVRGRQDTLVLGQHLRQADANHFALALEQVGRVLQSRFGPGKVRAHAIQDGRPIEGERRVGAYVVKERAERVVGGQVRPRGIGYLVGIPA